MSSDEDDEELLLEELDDEEEDEELDEELEDDEELLDEDELAAELGVDGVEAPVEGFGPSFAEELEELANEIESTSDEPK